MLESLHIANYALIDSVEIEFHRGFNTITGETGAGKSIMLGALSLLLGGRADAKTVRDANRKSIIEAVFSAGDYPALSEYCRTNDIEWDDSQCILRREIAPAGRSRAFINDSPVTLSQLETVAMQLIDIHSQHQNQLLTSPDYQLRIIDNLAGNGDRLRKYESQYNDYRNALKQLKEKREAIEKDQNDEDFTRFQLEQLEEMRLVEGEQEELERERELLSNMTDIKMTLNSALDALYNGKSNALSLLSEAVENCEELNPVLEDAESLTQRLESARIEIQDIAETLSDYDSNLNADPDELERIEDRLNSIYSLEHKHKVSTVEELIALRDNLRKRLDELESSDITIDELEKEVNHRRATAIGTAHEISAARKAEALKLAAELKKRALPLGMKNLRCEINVSPAEMSLTGTDKVEFLFSFNKNQPLMPVGGTASGGEISRLMLSVKSIIADKMQLPSIIFDEVDTGVSGDVANRMGEMMQSIARNIQVLAITHLPQVAALGDHHFKVFKEDDEQSTLTRIKELTEEQRIGELAVMLSGSKVDDAALANARSLLNNRKHQLS